MDKAKQQEYIDGIKDGMKQGVEDAFKNDMKELPEFIGDTLLMSLEMGLDQIERNERE